MITYIEESIQVGAIFGNIKKIKPVWFIWNKNRYNIKDVTYSWMSKEGKDTIYFFSVTDGNALYELSYNASNLVWKLVALEAE